MFFSGSIWLERDAIMLTFELKRILRLRSTIVILIIALLLACVLPFLSTIGINGYLIEDSGSLQILSGYDGVKSRREAESTYEGLATPDILWQVINNYQTLHAEYGDNIPNEIYIKEIVPAETLMKLIVSGSLGQGQYGYEGLLAFTQEDIWNFYELRNGAVEQYLIQQLGGNSSAYQVAKRMAGQVRVPFAFHACQGWPTACGNISGIVMIAIFAGCLLSSRVFSVEYQSGAYLILKSAKNGCQKLAKVKIVASLIVSGGLYLAILLVYSLLCVFIFGKDGLNVPIQFASFLSPVPFTFRDVYILSACMGLITVLAMSAFTLFLSSCFVSPAFPIAISWFLLVIQQLSGSLSAEWIQLLCDILPSSGSAVYGELFRINFLEIGNIAIWSPCVIFFTNLLAIPVCSILAIHFYCCYKLK